MGQPAPDAVDLEVDLLVVGAGMAGMSAAAYAAEQGAQVLVVDKAGEIGGSSVLSGTTLWTAPDLDAFRTLCPDGDDELGRVLVERFADALEWVRSTGVEFSGERSVVRFGRGYRFDVLGYLGRCTALVERAGGWVLTERTVEQLRQRSGRVCGADVRDSAGAATIASRGVLLATGGFQGDPQLRREQWGGELLLRANPHSVGDGLLLGQAVGAATSGDFAAFYGHSIASPQSSFGPADFGRLALQFSAEGVVVNRDGERFVDESRGDHVTAQRLVRQPGARGLVVVDRSVLRSPSLGASRLLTGPDHVQRTADDVFGAARAAGAHVAGADDLDELGALVTPWGFAGTRMAAAVRQYNEDMACDADTSPPRQWNRDAVSEAPFWAVEVEPAVTFTHGGLAVDSDARVLTAAGTPVPGLFAAGADVGGIYNGGYAGGLALALVFGLQAARALLRDRTDRNERVRV